MRARSLGVVLVLGVVSVVFVGAAVAQAPAPTSGLGVRITLAEAVAGALASNRDLTVIRRDVEIARGKLRQARRYPFNPELSVEGETGRAEGREERATKNVGGGKVGLSQVIEVRGQRGFRVRGAEAELARAEWAVRDREREVVADCFCREDRGVQPDRDYKGLVDMGHCAIPPSRSCPLVGLTVHRDRPGTGKRFFDSKQGVRAGGVHLF